MLRSERRVSPSQVRDNGLVQSDIIAERAYYLDGEPDSAVIGPGTSTLGLSVRFPFLQYTALSNAENVNNE